MRNRLSPDAVYACVLILDLLAYRMWSTGEGNDKPLQYSCLENPMNGMKRQNDRILKDELPRLVVPNDSLEKTLMLGNIEGRRRRGRQRIR